MHKQDYAVCVVYAIYSAAGGKIFLFLAKSKNKTTKI
jgi:hypothetical protein